MEVLSWFLLCLFAGVGVFGICRLALMQLEEAKYEQNRWESDYYRRDGRILSQNYPVTITELTGFFESEWFDSLVSIFEINPDNARVHIGIN